jgi:hypothetical protein
MPVLAAQEVRGNITAYQERLDVRMENIEAEVVKFQGRVGVLERQVEQLRLELIKVSDAVW